MTDKEMADVYPEPVRWVRDRVELANLSKLGEGGKFIAEAKAPAEARSPSCPLMCRTPR